MEQLPLTTPGIALLGDHGLSPRGRNFLGD